MRGSTYNVLVGVSPHHTCTHSFGAKAWWLGVYYCGATNADQALCYKQLDRSTIMNPTITIKFFA